MSVAGSHRCGAQVRVAKRTTNGRRGGRACVHGSCRAFASGAGVLRRGGSPGQRCAGGACHDSKSSRRMRSACTSERWCRPADCELHRARAPQRSGSGTRADCGVSLSSHTRADHPPNLKRIATRARLVACKNHATDGRVKALCVCFKAPRTYTPALSALVSPLEGHSPQSRLLLAPRRRARLPNTPSHPFVWEQGTWPIFQSCDNSALRGRWRLVF